MLKSPNRNELDPYIRQYDVAIDLSSQLLRSKLISILFKSRDVVYVQITNISLASRLMCRSTSLTAVTSHRLAGEIRRTLSSDIILEIMHLNGRAGQFWSAAGARRRSKKSAGAARRGRHNCLRLHTCFKSFSAKNFCYKDMHDYSRISCLKNNIE